MSAPRRAARRRSAEADTGRTPPALLLLAAYGAGLATGLVRFPALGCVLALLLGGATLVRRPDRGAARWPSLRVFALALLIGAGTGTAAEQVDRRRCAASLGTGPVALTGVLAEPAGLDEAPVTVRPATCGAGELRVRWPRRAQPLAEGTPVRITGRWLPREGRRADGIVAADRIEPLGPAAPSVGDRLRGAAMRASQRLYGARAPLVDALVLGRRGSLDRALVQDFAASGLVHLLSISGFHVGVIVAWLVLLARAAGWPQGRALLAASAGATLYVVWLGWPAPAARAAMLAWLLALARVRQRPSTDLATLAVSCLAVLLADPWAVLDLGGWLSASALWGATHFARQGQRLTGENWLSQTGWGSLGATLATAPICAAMLGSIAPVGIMLNFVAIPLGALAVPGVVFSLMLAPVPGLAEALAAGSGAVLAVLEQLARWGAAVPGGSLVVTPGWQAGAVALGALLVGCWVLAPGLTRWAIVGRGAMLAAAGSWWLVVYDLRGRGAADGALGLFFLDVGQGDAAAIRTPGGHWVLVDAGPADERRDAGHRIVGPWLRRAGARRLDALVVSHAHADHLGGAGAVLAQVPADVVLEPASPTDDARYLRFLGQVAASGVRWQPARSAMAFTLDGVQFRFVHPDTAWTEWGLDLNEDSAVLLVEYGAFRALFAGDAGLPAEARLRGRVGDVDLLKVGHHGSRGASGDAWLSELRPEFAVISVGRGNRYGHPAPEALARLRAAHARIMRTDEEGTITVVTDGREQMTVTGRSGTVHRALRAPVRSP